MSMRRGRYAAGVVIGATALSIAVALNNSFAASQDSAGTAATCGVERWPVKTLSDPREKLVNYKPHDSSIGRLRKKPHPHVGPNTKRIEGVETTNYRVAARLVEMKLEEDRDIHLVVSVPSAPAKTMIVEFPDPTCNGASSSPKKGKMECSLGDHRGLRSALLQSLHPRQWQGDGHRGRLLRHSARPDGSGAERD